MVLNKKKLENLERELKEYMQASIKKNNNAKALLGNKIKKKYSVETVAEAIKIYKENR